MNSLKLDSGGRSGSYGEHGLSLVDRLGVSLSRQAILRNLPRRRDLVVLDIGCGYNATNLRALYPYMAAGTGIDFSVDPAVGNMPRLSVIEGPIQTTLRLLQPEQYDLVLLISVLEHLEEPLLTLRECKRLLKKGGTLLINVPTWRGKLYLEFAAFRLRVSPAEEMDDHKTYYDLPDLWPLLVKAGFRPRLIRLSYHKLGLNLFGVVQNDDETNESNSTAT